MKNVRKVGKGRINFFNTNEDFECWFNIKKYCNM